MEIIIKENSIVLNYIKIKKENKNLFKNLLYILFSSENQIDFFIKEELKHLNFNFKNKGTLYLIDCIKISYLNNIYYNYNNNIFPYIEKKYSTNSNNIKAQQSEISEINCFKYEDAISMITYEDGRKVLMKAIELLNK